MNKVVCFVLTLTILAFQSVGALFAYENILIGALYSATGSYSSIESPALSGALLAAKELNGANGLLGKKIELAPTDVRGGRTAVRDAVSRFAVEQKVVAVVGLGDPLDASAAGFLAQKAGMPFVCIGADASSLPDRFGGCMYLVGGDLHSQAYGLARFAYHDLRARTAYVLVDDSADASKLQLASLFKIRFKQFAGFGAILLEDSFHRGDNDFAIRIQRLKTLDPLPDVLMAAVEGNDFIEIVKQFRGAGIERPIMGGERFGSSLLAETRDAFLRNVYFSTQNSFESESVQVKNFVEKYKEEFGHAPENAFAALGYDALRLIATAIVKAGNCERRSILKALAETKGFEGLTGTIGYGDSFLVPKKNVSLITVTGGKLSLAKEITPP
ncbi:MAG: ABC transporter substrate-binding protein [Deltaproteobacteria bacterium]|nr:ABC transporter substrate-binding protein [Deltaproteobacteria bacterium]